MTFLDEYIMPLRTAAFAVTITVFLLSIRQWIYAKKIVPDDLTEIPGVKLRLLMLSALLLTLFYIYSGLYLLLCLLMNLANIFMVKKMTNTLTRIGYNVYVTDNLMDGKKEIERPDLAGLPCFFLEPSFNDYLESCSFFNKEDKKKIRAESAALEKSRKSAFG